MKLTQTQQAIVDAVDQSIGIIAGAGTGKTRVMVERCARLLEMDPTNARHLLAISFTERAAQELRHRLEQRVDPSLRASIRGAHITTFHGFCMHMLREHAPLLGLTPQFQLLDAEASEQLLVEAIRTAILQSIDRGCDGTQYLLTLQRFDNLVQIMSALVAERWNVLDCLHDNNIRLGEVDSVPTETETAVQGNILTLLNTCIDEYSRAKNACYSVDFHDLEIFALQLLKEHSTICGDYQQQFQHIIVDEFQDTNFIQMEIITALYTPPDNTLCIVGDPKQSIYRFRGAQSECFANMLAHISRHGGRVVNLRDNFRSAPNILQFVNTCCDNIPEDQHLHAGNPDIQGNVYRLQIEPTDSAHERRIHEAEQIAAFIREGTLTKQFAYGDVACLFATHTAIPLCEAILKAQGIPTQVHSGQGFLESQVVTDIVHVARCLTEWLRGAPDDASLLTALQTPCFGLSAEQCYELRYQTENNTQHAAAPLWDHALAEAEIGAHFRHWQTLAPLLSNRELLESIITTTHLQQIAHNSDPSGQELANIDKLLALADAGTAQSPQTLEEFLTEISQMQARAARLAQQPIMPTGQNAVQLLTIHASKGNEFPIVILGDISAPRVHRFHSWQFIPGVGYAAATTEDTTEYYSALKSYDKTAHNAELERLLYVALTRAERELILALSPAKRDPKPESWAGMITSACNALGIATITPKQCSADDADHEPRIHHRHTMRTFAPPPRVTHVTVTQLEAFTRCPEEYRLKYRLGIPASTLDWPQLDHMPANLRGEIVHAAIHTKHQHPQRSWNDILAEELAVCGYHELAVNQQELMLQILHNVDLARLDQHSITEVPFRIALKTSDTHSAIISGTIDHLEPRDSGWVILDYKTDALMSATQDEVETHAEKYALQLALYALAAHDAGYTPIHSTELHFLKHNLHVMQKITPHDIEQTRAHTRALINELLSEQTTIRANTPCESCIFQQNKACTKSSRIAI